MAEIAANPLAVEYIGAKTPIGSPLNSAEWSDVPIALRNRAQFSAEVEKLRLLQRIQDRLEQAIGQIRNERGVFVNEAQFVAEMQKIGREEGLDPRNFADKADRFGGLQDITSEKRLKLIYRTQIQMANEYARWRKANDPAVLNAFPAQEFLRVQSRRVPRSNWPERFEAAGGKIIRGRMVALISDPVWRKLSVFGNPYPPFDYGSGMGLRSLSRRESESLGLIKPGEVPKSAFEDFNAHLEASVQDLAPDFQDALKKIFGNQIEIKDGVAKWVDLAEVKAPAPSLPADVRASASTGASGTPVSLAARIATRTKKEGARIQAVLTAIDRVHGDGALQPIPFNNRIVRGSLGSYYSSTNAASSIGVRAGEEGSELSLAHEVGHWLDHIGLESTGRFASESSSGELRGWLQAVQASDAYKKVQAGVNLRSAYRSYLLTPRELWARSYAQFIAEESGQPAMQARLQKILGGSTTQPAISQWSTEDFAPIRAAIRELFIRLGWILPPAG